ncbi:MAG: exopolysaccharide biosynthesis polyprenyl glycosylphosphotransferase [Rhodothermales bacterium]|nr:exopolysaccharide biosynthesis polyprenyl glycosylphosphotransferase [Rhodothermales bacterium]
MPDYRQGMSGSGLVTTSPLWTRLSLLAADLFSGLTVVGLSYLWAGPGTISASKLLFFFVLTVIGIACGGMYNKIVVHPAMEMKRIFVIICSITFVLLAGTLSVNFSTIDGYRQLVFTGIGFAFLAPTIRATLRLSLGRSAWWGESCAIITRDKEIFETLKRVPELGLKPVALYTEDNVLNDADNAHASITQNGKISYVLLSRPELDLDEMTDLRRKARRVFREVIMVPNPSSHTQWTTQTVHDALLVYGVRRTETWFVGPLLKRIFDLVVATATLLATLPIMVIIAILVRLDSKGACIFRQERLGHYGKTFNVFKFRTMALDAEARLAELLESDAGLKKEYETFHKLRYDPRITNVGRVLRRFSLDELPQLVNVIMGDMSLVGPRAYMPQERTDMLNLDDEILREKPGISGLWQVSGRNRLSFEERVWTDVTYNRNVSVWMDLFLLMKTVPVVLSGDGAN